MLKGSDYYDKVFLASDSAYQIEYDKNPYRAIWDPVLKFVGQDIQRSSVRILELGCGNGILAEKLIRVVDGYLGVDFSPVAIEQARKRCGDELATFCVCDISKPSSDVYRWPYTHVIAVEVLEHVDDDLAVVSMIERGAIVIFSVPDFMCESHVRVYPSEEFVRNRFKGLLGIGSVITRRSPFTKVRNKFKTRRVCRGVRL